jgi:hypothetical protein
MDPLKGCRNIIHELQRMPSDRTIETAGLDVQRCGVSAESSEVRDSGDASPLDRPIEHLIGDVRCEHLAFGQDEATGEHGRVPGARAQIEYPAARTDGGRLHHSVSRVPQRVVA